MKKEYTLTFAAEKKNYSKPNTHVARLDAMCILMASGGGGPFSISGGHTPIDFYTGGADAGTGV